MIIRDENYFTDKYELTRTHSEVLEAVKVVKPGKTLDLAFLRTRYIIQYLIKNVNTFFKLL